MRKFFGFSLVGLMIAGLIRMGIYWIGSLDDGPLLVPFEEYVGDWCDYVVQSGKQYCRVER